MTGSVLWKIMRTSGAVWKHSGYPRAPHVVLRSGRHSDGFIDTLQYLSNTKRLVEASRHLALEIRKMVPWEGIDCVFGSPMAGIPFATMVGYHLGTKQVSFTEKTGERELICRHVLPLGATFMAIEEMTTSGATPARSVRAVLSKNPKARPSSFIGAFLVRCGRHPPDLDGSMEIIPVISLPELGVSYHEWEPDECPLCEEGSRAIANCKRVWTDLLRTMFDPAHPIPEG